MSFYVTIITRKFRKKITYLHPRITIKQKYKKNKTQEKTLIFFFSFQRNTSIMTIYLFFTSASITIFTLVVLAYGIEGRHVLRDLNLKAIGLLFAAILIIGIKFYFIYVIYSYRRIVSIGIL